MPLGFEEIYSNENVGLEETDGSISVSDSNHVEGPDFGGEQESLFNHARDQFNAGLSATAGLYDKISDHTASKDPYTGAFAYDNKKSIHFTS